MHLTLLRVESIKKFKYKKLYFIILVNSLNQAHSKIFILSKKKNKQQKCSKMQSKSVFFCLPNL